MSTVEFIAILLFNTTLGAYIHQLDGATIAFLSTIIIHVLVEHYSKDKSC